jgi:hypothetical protein
MCRRGRLHRRHRGVYAVGHPRLSREGTWHAAVLAAGPDAALSHVSAAQHWKITRRATNQVHVSTPRHRRRQDGFTSHLLRDLQPLAAAVTTRDHLRVTTLERTIIDLAECMDAEELAFVMHEADLQYQLRLDVIDTVLRDHPRFRGRHVLIDALTMHREGLTGSRSGYERRLTTYVVSHGFPRPRVGYVLHADDGRYELDLAWPEYRICIEADGHAVHRRATTRRTDRERDRALDRAGWRHFRIVDTDFDADPSAATAAAFEALRRALEEARAST